MINLGPTSRSSTPAGKHDAHWAPGRNSQGISQASTHCPKASVLAGRRFVFVDDNPDLVAVCARLLGAYGAKVVGTCSHDDAFAEVQKNSADAIVSNLGEDGRGFELIDRIREADDPQMASVPAVALSGYDNGEMIERAFARGFDLYLPKPVQLNELVRALASVTRPIEARAQHAGHGLG